MNLIRKKGKLESDLPESDTSPLPIWNIPPLGWNSQVFKLILLNSSAKSGVGVGVKVGVGVGVGEEVGVGDGVIVIVGVGVSVGVSVGVGVEVEVGDKVTDGVGEEMGVIFGLLIGLIFGMWKRLKGGICIGAIGAIRGIVINADTGEAVTSKTNKPSRTPKEKNFHLNSGIY